MVPEQNRELHPRPARNVEEKVRWYIPSSLSLVWCRMYARARTVTEPVRLSKTNARTATEPAIRASKKEDCCIDSGRYRQWTEYPYQRKGRTGYQRRSERGSAGRSSVIPASDFPETGYRYILYRTDQFPGGSTWRNDPYQDRGRRSRV